MKNIDEILKKHGIEVDPEKKEAFEKDFHDNYKTVAEVDKIQKRVTSLEEEKESLVKRHEEELEKRDKDLQEVSKQLKESEGGAEELKKVQEKLKNLEEENKQNKKQYQEDLANQKNEFLLKDAVSKLKFSSKSAQELFLQKAREEKFKVKDDKIQGWDDFVESFKQSDETAFVNEEEPEGEGKEEEPQQKSNPHFGGKMNGKASEPEPEGDNEEVPEVW